jgi:hypothetical protein
LEKFSGYGEGNPKSSDFAAAIGNKPAKADPEIAYASGRDRPIAAVNT